jgi:hypothetical protein
MVVIGSRAPLPQFRLKSVDFHGDISDTLVALHDSEKTVYG